MNPLDAVRILLVRDLAAFARELDLFPDEASVWAVLPGVSNSAGNLALHVAGNLQHFIGHVLGGTGYQRDRDQEFARRSGSRGELKAELARAREVLERVLSTLPEERLAAPFPGVPGGLSVPTGTWLLHLATHLAFHLGQAGTLRRALTASSATSGAMGLKDLEG